MPDDIAIWAAFSRYVYMTVEQASLILGRPRDTLQNRFQTLAGFPQEKYRIKYLGRVQDGPFGPYLYFMKPEGGKRAFAYGYLPEARWVQKKHPKSITHDSMITWIHFLLESALRHIGRELIWEQWRTDLHDIREAVGAYPDARLCIKGDSEFSLLEVVEANESGHREHEKNLTEKLEAYMDAGVARVYITMPTKARVMTYLKKLKQNPKLDTSKIWVSDEDSIKADIMGKIWLTPKNYAERTYSILPPVSHT